jgi:hypothetical protein
LNIKLKRILRPLAAALFLLLILACNKKEDGIGVGVLPDDVLLGVNFTDTMTLEAYTVLDDSVRADGVEGVLLGNYHDPEFGTLRSGFYTQLRLSTNQPLFTAGAGTGALEVDSVVLSLAFSGEQYGYDFPQRYAVHELNEQLYADSLYFSNRIMDIKPQNLVLPESRYQRPAPDKQVIVGSDTLAPQLRLRLDNVIGRRLFDAVGTDSLSAEGFTSFIKGLYVSVEDEFIPPGNGGIHYFNLIDPASKVTVYYRLYNRQGADAGFYELRSYDLLINTNSVYFTRSFHDYTTALPNLFAQLQGDWSTGGQQTFVQAASGVKTRVIIPYLGDFPNDSLAINKAELIIPFNINTTFPPPNRVFAIGRNEAENSAFLLPDIFEGDGHFGGFLNIINSEYRINISRWAQQVSFGSRENTPIDLVADRATNSANRVIFNGPQHPDRRMRLVVHYTKY